MSFAYVRFLNKQSTPCYDDTMSLNWIGILGEVTFSNDTLHDSENLGNFGCKFSISTTSMLKLYLAHWEDTPIQAFVGMCYIESDGRDCSLVLCLALAELYRVGAINWEGNRERPWWLWNCLGHGWHDFSCSSYLGRVCCSRFHGFRLQLCKPLQLDPFLQKVLELIPFLSCIYRLMLIYWHQFWSLSELTTTAATAWLHQQWLARSLGLICFFRTQSYTLLGDFFVAKGCKYSK